MHPKDANTQSSFRAHYSETLIYAAYYAPRGRQRLYMVGAELSRRYLNPADLIIGIIGAEGSGKSTLIRGLFPGLELTNDDDGVNIRPARLYDFTPDDFFAPHTFHIDVRYEAAFKQKFEIAEAINRAVARGRRVIIEHFDLIYKTLGYNAQIIFGIGEEIIVARPSVFGPFPAGIKSVVDKTIKYRLMAHSAEDITTYVLERDYNYKNPVMHSDVKHGFVINFAEKPEIDPAELEARVQDIIRRDVPIQASGENHIRIGEHEMVCTGTRTHVASSGRIENFRLLHEYKYHPIFKEYLLVGMVGRKETISIEEIANVVDQQ
ncbi:MAG: alanine-tRNA synthetase second additional domain-containing protein [Kiritimatiellae bacterium]|nr:alanine-tRNA synthetase second additional domain-containing protein [Kiritimatiellia bacterium]